jgi:diacylglycerol kinase family enzyme
MIVNPNARRTSSSVRARVVRALGREHEVVSLVTSRAGDGRRLALEALESGCSVVLALGGDGTVNEVAGAIEDTGAVLCPVPLGGTNVFARALGWPAAPDAAVSLLPAALRAFDSHTRSIRLWSIDAGGATGHVCLNAGVGMDADVVAEVERHPLAKRTFGQGAFAVAAARAFEHTARRGGVLSVRSDDGEPVTVHSISLAIGGPYAYLGAVPLDLVPGAHFDGHLHWLALSRGGRRDIARVAVGAFASARHVRDSAVVSGVAHEGLTISAAEPVAVQVDGEPLGEHREVRLAPAGLLRALCPRSCP